MKHEIKLIWIENLRDEHNCREFRAAVDGIEFKGKVQRIIADWKGQQIYSYRMYFPKELSITKSPDYKNIRRELLTQMTEQVPYEMIEARIVVR